MTPHSFYIAGPMTGIPQFNFPAFDTAAAELRDQGYEIVSPAELDDPSTREAALASPDGAPGSGSANDESYGTFLSRDVKLIIDEVDGVVTLPNFEKSRGARIEVFTALTMGKPAYFYDASDGTITRWTSAHLTDLLKPGDPGNGEQHRTPAEAVGPPYALTAQRAEPQRPGFLPPYDATREPGHIHEELRRDDWMNAIAKGLEEADKMAPGGAIQVQLPEDCPMIPDYVFGIPTLVTRYASPGQVTIITGHTEPVHVLVAGLARMKEREELREGHQVEDFLSRAGVTPPPGEERITSASGGQKGQKLCAIGDLDPQALMEVGKVAGFGAKKYARLNYTKGFDWSLAFNALMRHALEFWSGNDYDEESELPHMAHAAWQCLCLLSFAQHLRGTDDRHINFYMEGGPREFEDGS